MGKPKVDKLNLEKLKEKKMDIFNINKDVKRAKDSLSGKEKIKSNKDHKHKMKAKHENELKDFLSATATIKKEAKREKEEHRKDTLKNISLLKDKKDLKEDVLFSPTATIVQAMKPKVDKLNLEKLKEKKMDIFNINKDVKRAKDSLS